MDWIFVVISGIALFGAGWIVCFFSLDSKESVTNVLTIQADDSMLVWYEEPIGMAHVQRLDATLKKVVKKYEILDGVPAPSTITVVQGGSNRTM